MLHPCLPLCGDKSQRFTEPQTKPQTSSHAVVMRWLGKVTLWLHDRTSHNYNLATAVTIRLLSALCMQIQTSVALNFQMLSAVTLPLVLLVDKLWYFNWHLCQPKLQLPFAFSPAKELICVGSVISYRHVLCRQDLKCTYKVYISHCTLTINVFLINDHNPKSTIRLIWKICLHNILDQNWLPNCLCS